MTRLGLRHGAPRPGIYEPVSDEQAAVVLDHAWDYGIRYYDTAPLYGYTLGERRLGRMLQGTRPRRVRHLDQGRAAHDAAGGGRGPPGVGP